MTHGLRRRSATIRRLGIGFLLFGAAIGCQGTDKLPASSLSPPPKLPSSLPAPSSSTGATSSTNQTPPTTRTSTPTTTPASAQTTAWNNNDMAARAGLNPKGTGQPAPIAAPTLPSTDSTMPLVPAGVPTGGRGSHHPTPEPSSPTYQPPTVLKDPTPPAPPAGSGATPIAPVSPPTADAPSAPALPSAGSVAAPSGPIAAPSMPLGSGH